MVVDVQDPIVLSLESRKEILDSALLAEEVGDDAQDIPHSLELGDECDNNKDLEHAAGVAVGETGWKQANVWNSK